MVEKVIWSKAVSDAVSIMDRTGYNGHFRLVKRRITI